MNPIKSISLAIVGILAIALAAMFFSGCSSNSYEDAEEATADTSTLPDATVADSAEEELDEVIVTGFRRTLADSDDAKRKAVSQAQTPSPALAREAKESFSAGADMEPLVEKENIKRHLDGIWGENHAHQIFNHYGVNPTISTAAETSSTFAIDVDDGSYKLALKMLNEGYMPAEEGIRVEEFVNAMDYKYLSSKDLFSLSAEAMPSPYRKGYHVLHLGIQGKEISEEERRPINLVLVADTSGSMASDNKLELLKKAFLTLCGELKKEDHVALVAYDDTAKVILRPTDAKNRRVIANAINALRTGGSTNAEAGLKLAHSIAKLMYQPGLNNRIIFSSDGMANVGASNADALIEAVNQSRDQSIFISTVGVGYGMYNDALLEQLANKGNGQYLYIGSDNDIRVAFVDKFSSQIQTIAKNVKTQVEFNPEFVSHYRLLGYENRSLKNEDFLDASKDGGEIGAGHKVTAIYEVKFKKTPRNTNIAQFRLAYQKPEGEKIYTIEKAIPASIIKSSFKNASFDLRLSSSTAAFAEKLRESYWSQNYDYADIKDILKTLPSNYIKARQVETLIDAVSKAALIDDREPRYAENAISQNFNFDNVPLLK